MSHPTNFRSSARLALGLAGLSLLTHTQAQAQCVTPLQTFDYTGSIVSYSVPSTGDYWIEAAGAEGGSLPTSPIRPGRGAKVGGKFHLTAGTNLSVLVGQQAPIYGSFFANGGGGGSFVVLTGTAPPQALVVGGGGAGSANTDSTGKHGQAGQSGADAFPSGGAGGSAGNGGGSVTSTQDRAGGGGGLLGNGADGTGWWGAMGGLAFVNGGSGGSSGNLTPGGFGGGGAGSAVSTSGGGGGYSGGGGAQLNGQGGGGGSFNAGADPSTLSGDTDGHSGNGQVRICTTNAPADLVITSAAPSAGVAGSAYGPITLAATGGWSPYTWSAVNLPSGLNLNPSTGVLSGTPAVGSQGSYTITVSDASSPTPRTASVTLQVLPALAAEVKPVPTLGGWSLALLSMLAAGLGLNARRRKA